MVNVHNAEIYKNEACPNGCLRLFWEGDKGVGQYDLIIRSNEDDDELKITGDSEYMDKGEDKVFLRSLFESLLDKIEIIG